MTLGFLRRNLAFAPRQTMETVCKTLVRPQLEHASSIWHPYLKTQAQQIEKVQRSAARWTCRRWRNKSSVGDMFSELEWPSLETHQEQSSLTFFYKIHSDTVYIDKDKYLIPHLVWNKSRLGHFSPTTHNIAGTLLIVMPWKFRFFLFFFFPELHVSPLDSSAVGAQAADAFKAHIYSAYGEACVLACLCLDSCK